MISYLKNYLFLLSIFFLRSKIKRSNKIYIYDIDNTLSDSWPYLKEKKTFPRRLPYFSKIRNDILKKINSGNLIFFATVRHYKHYFDTYFWLKELGIKVKMNQLLFFSYPNQKVDFIKSIKEINSSIKLYDDMSYNHENNQVLFYDEVIKKIKKLNIEYIDYHNLKKYQDFTLSIKL